MSKLLHRCRWCSWLRHVRDIRLRDLRDDSGLQGMTIRQKIWCMAWCHERMWDAEEPVHVVTGTLTWHSAHLTYWNNMIRVVHPPVVYIIIRHLWIDKRSRNGLRVSKLPHDPLWSVINSNRPPAQETGIAWYDMEVPDRSVFPIRDSTDIQNPKSVQALPVRRCTYVLHGLLRRNPPTRTRGILIVFLISSGVRNWGKVLVNPALQM